MTQDPKLSTIAARIRALQAKTTAAGATEAEAMAAAAKARELLDKYQLDLSELEIRAEGTSEGTVRRDSTEIADRLYANVGKYCDCKCWLRRNGADGNTARFIGLRGDVAFAQWLLSSLVGFVQRKGVEFSIDADEPATQAQVQSFIIGATRRINERLQDEIAARQQQALAISTKGALVLRTKQALVQEAYDKLGLKLYSTSTNNTATRRDAFAAGHAAGAGASFARPVGQGAQTLRIGKAGPQGQ